MDNAAVAAVFAEMGDLLSIVGGDPYRARAFKNTARVVEGLRTPLPDMIRLGQLKGVRGLGEGSVERIQQILRTGTCADHQKLLQRLPRGLRELLTLRGLGPRHVRLAHEHLGVTNLAQLELAARSGLLARVPGIGPLTVERVLRDLEGRKEAPPPRLLLSEALAVGEALVAWMLDDPHTIRAEQTGSARRRKETVGDLDVLVASTAPLRSSARFVAFPGVREVLMSGDARASVILEGTGVQADLRLVPVENWGAGLHYFTGSKAHNIALRVRANSAKLALSELGVWERKLRGRGRGEENRKIAKRLTPGTDEADIFAALGLPFIPPELREGDGEIEAALAGRLPRLVDDVDLLGEPGLRARTRAEAVTIGHALARQGRRWAFWVRPAIDLPDDDARRRFARDCRRVGHDTGVVVWPAVEIAIASDGGVDDAGARAVAFVVVGDATPVPGLDRDAATARLVSAVQSGRLHGLVRVQGRVLPGDDHDARSAGADIDLRSVLHACARRRVFVEVSGEPERPDLEARACRTATETGALLALSARAVVVDDVDRLRFARFQARRGWATAAATLNALPVIHLAAQLGLAAPDDVAAVHVDDGADDDDGAADVDPLFAPARRAELRQRLAAFLQGHDDDELRRALETKGGHPLQAAFALLAASADDSDDDPQLR